MPSTRNAYTKTNIASASYLTCSEDSGGYRFGFNSQEKDNEITGVEGAHNTAEFWMYDTRLGRRWNVDPVDQVSISNYACFGNNPVENVDINGDFKTRFAAWLYNLFNRNRGTVEKNRTRESERYGEWYVSTSKEVQSFGRNFQLIGKPYIQLQSQVVTEEIVYDWPLKLHKNDNKKEPRGGIHFYSKQGIGRDPNTGDYGLPSHGVEFDEWINLTNGVEKSKKIFKSIIERISDANEALERGESLSNDENLSKSTEKDIEKRQDSVYITTPLGSDYYKVPAEQGENNNDTVIYHSGKRMPQKRKE